MVEFVIACFKHNFKFNHKLFKLPKLQEWLMQFESWIAHFNMGVFHLK